MLKVKKKHPKGLTYRSTIIAPLSGLLMYLAELAKTTDFLYLSTSTDTAVKNIPVKVDILNQLLY